MPEIHTWWVQLEIKSLKENHVKTNHVKELNVRISESGK